MRNSEIFWSIIGLVIWTTIGCWLYTDGIALYKQSCPVESPTRLWIVLGILFHTIVLIVYLNWCIYNRHLLEKFNNWLDKQ